MIFLEQQELDPTRFNPYAKLWIVSGILVEQKKKYLKKPKKRGWHPIEEFSRGDWMGWIFSIV